MSESVLDYDASIYYDRQYVFWNSYEYVQKEINRRISGDPGVLWAIHFRKRMGDRKFKKALMLNCGNGWVERFLWTQGYFEEAVGVDYAQSLIEEARLEANGLPLRYYRLDTNTADFPESGYDLVVNYAAAHHITYLDHVFRRLAQMLPDDGIFLNYDFVGAHRNQYPATQWLTALRLNARLPKRMRSPMHYPHLQTTLRFDPSEAVHSELVVPIMHRYFHFDEHKHMGGGLAYLILTHNHNFYKVSQVEQDRWLKVIMDADAAYLAQNPASSQFDFIVARPNKAILANRAQVEAWTCEEEEREARAVRNNLEYYPRSAYGNAYYSIIGLRDRVKNVLRKISGGGYRMHRSASKYYRRPVALSAS